MPNLMHLGWLASFSAPTSSGPFTGHPGDSWADGRSHATLARALERAKFDFLLLDGPQHDPFPLVSLLASATENLGILATASTGFYPPYMLARALSTLDHVSHGRVGWNITACSDDLVAQNAGSDGLGDEAERYLRADEFMQVVQSLWSSWEPDALLMNHETGHYVDHTKVHTIDHVGTYFRVRGPLNTMPSPQGRPVFSHACTTERSRQFAAEQAEIIVAPGNGAAAMHAFRVDLHERMTALGRNPAGCTILYLVDPVLGETDADALEKQHATDAATDDSTLRLVGSVDTVADQMGELMDEVGGDGFIFCGPGSGSRIAEITDGLVPALQRRGLTQKSYAHTTFRDNLAGS